MPTKQDSGDDDFLESCARSIALSHGSLARSFVSERIAYLARDLDFVAIATWKRIQDKVANL